MKILISGTGLFTPKEQISNDELVKSYNQWVSHYNQKYASEISANTLAMKPESSSEFIEKASGIRSRFVVDKSGILDEARMEPNIPQYGDSGYSIQCEMAIEAAKEAMENAGKSSDDIDFVIVASSNMQRGFPAIAIELQSALGIDGYGFDMNVACSSASFAIQVAMNAILAKQAKTILMVNPEVCTAQVDFRDRNSHFIFGDACTAAIIESSETATSACQFEIKDCFLTTAYSRNIRNEYGFLTQLKNSSVSEKFNQQGRKVFKEVTPMVANIILRQLEKNKLTAEDIAKIWLHQANSNMNRLIGTKVFGYEPDETKAPIALDEYANTSSAGSMIVFHKTCNDVPRGAYGVLCSFGAGYSVGSLIVQRVK